MAAKPAFPRFQRGETLSAALRRMAGEQRSRAGQLVGSSRPPDEVVHGVRLVFKFLRALLRLSRDGVGSQFVRRENARLRQAALELSSWRDEKVVQDTLRDLGQKLPGKSGRLMKDVLKERQKSSAARQKRRKPLKKIFSDALNTLADFQQEVDQHPVTDKDWDSISEGLQRSYRKATHALKVAEASDVDESFHDARKRVKDLFYHVALLEKALPREEGGLEDELLKLQALLGREHDTTVAQDVVLHLNDSGKNQETALRNLRDRSRKLRKKIRVQAERVFDKRTKSVVRRTRKKVRKWNKARET